nr:leukocyte surface antigen CD53-like [Onthophagus taurus]
MDSTKQSSTNILTYFNIIYMILGYYFLISGILIFEFYKPIFSIYPKEAVDSIVLLDAGRGATSILVLYSLIYGMIMLSVGLLGTYILTVQGICELKTFATILGILSISKIILGILMILISLNVLLPLQVWGYMTVNFVKMKNDVNAVQAQLFLQEKYNCCGVNNSTDYDRLFPYNTSQIDILGADNCTTFNETQLLGCEMKVSESYFCQWQLMGVTSFCISLLEIVGVILIHRAIKNLMFPKRFFNPDNLPRYYLEDDLTTY